MMNAKALTLELLRKMDACGCTVNYLSIDKWKATCAALPVSDAGCPKALEDADAEKRAP